MSFTSKRNILVPMEFQTEEQRDLYDWMYEVSLDQSIMLWGEAMFIAGKHPDWTYWQVVAELRRLNNYLYGWTFQKP